MGLPTLHERMDDIRAGLLPADRLLARLFVRVVRGRLCRCAVRGDVPRCGGQAIVEFGIGRRRLRHRLAIRAPPRGVGRAAGRGRRDRGWGRPPRRMTGGSGSGRAGCSAGRTRRGPTAALVRMNACVRHARGARLDRGSDAGAAPNGPTCCTRLKRVGTWPTTSPAHASSSCQARPSCPTTSEPERILGLVRGVRDRAYARSQPAADVDVDNWVTLTKCRAAHRRPGARRSDQPADRRACLRVPRHRRDTHLPHPDQTRSR